MKVIITGGTGFIGKCLSVALVEKGYRVLALTRSSRPSDIKGVRNLVWDGRSSSGWVEHVEGATAIVNLAGENIASGRWSAAKKKRIEQSRLDAGHAVCEAVTKTPKKPSTVIQGSAIGFYGPRGPQPVDEADLPHKSFLSEVAAKWESSTLPVEDYGVRRAIIRTGMVLGHGGALSKMLPPFKLGFGSFLGEGHQGVSWIHINDVVRAIIFLIENDSCKGVFNLSSINPVTSNKFNIALGKVLGKPVRLRVPECVVKLLFGQMAEEILIGGQFVLPEKLVEAGFNFEYAEVEDALVSLLK